MAHTVNDADQLDLSTITSEGGFVVVEIANGVRHHLHRTLLTEQSEYFEKALKGPWKEADEGVVRLDDVESGPFNTFVDWLHTGGVPWEDYDPNSSGDENDIIELTTLKLGNRLLAPVFVKALQRHFVEKHVGEFASSTRWCKSPSFEVIICAFEILKDDNPILTMLVDQHVKYYTVTPTLDALGGGRRAGPKLPYDFLVRIVHRYGQAKIAAKTRLQACDYHGHASQ
ncbi:hypothetical protein N0V95_001994 [Ascochyta clinopodiicola]|nr:hypothetical protein N0V95_001994 [Ascochyta clinopodiicola]